MTSARVAKCPKCSSVSYDGAAPCLLCGYVPGRQIVTNAAPEPVAPLPPEEMRGRMMIGAGLPRDRSRSYAGRLAVPEGPKEEAVRKCKVPRCDKAVTTAKPSAGYCYRHLRELAPEACPPSMRVKRPAGKQKAGRPAKASQADGCCPSCGAPALPTHQQEIFREMVAEGLRVGLARKIAERVGKAE